MNPSPVAPLAPARPRRMALAALWLACAGAPLSAAHASSCSIISPSFGFPDYRPLNPVPDAGFSALIVNCALSVGQLADSINYAVSLSTGSSGTYATRTFMGQPLDYNLYTTANHTQVWGDGTAGTVTVAGHLSLPGNSSITHPIYGLIPARQNVTTGMVSDHIVVTIDY